MGKKLIALSLLSMSMLGFAGEASQVLNQAKQNMIQKAYSYGDTAIESWAKDNLSIWSFIAAAISASP